MQSLTAYLRDPTINAADFEYAETKLVKALFPVDQDEDEADVVAIALDEYGVLGAIAELPENPPHRYKHLMSAALNHAGLTPRILFALIGKGGTIAHLNFEIIELIAPVDERPRGIEVSLPFRDGSLDYLDIVLGAGRADLTPETLETLIRRVCSNPGCTPWYLRIMKRHNCSVETMVEYLCNYFFVTKKHLQVFTADDFRTPLTKKHDKFEGRESVRGRTILSLIASGPFVPLDAIRHATSVSTPEAAEIAAADMTSLFCGNYEGIFSYEKTDIAADDESAERTDTPPDEIFTRWYTGMVELSFREFGFDYPIYKGYIRPDKRIKVLEILAEYGGMRSSATVLKYALKNITSFTLLDLSDLINLTGIPWSLRGIEPDSEHFDHFDHTEFEYTKERREYVCRRAQRDVLQ